jgi:hypothetical protein
MAIVGAGKVPNCLRFMWANHVKKEQYMDLNGGFSSIFDEQVSQFGRGYSSAESLESCSKLNALW